VPAGAKGTERGRCGSRLLICDCRRAFPADFGQRTLFGAQRLGSRSFRRTFLILQLIERPARGGA
jgi:hypothetical protein